MKRYFVNKKYFLFLYFNFIVFFFLNILFRNQIFTSETDGFYYQIMSVQSNQDLGSLYIVHSLRLLIIYPFYLLDKFSMPLFLQHFFLLLYCFPVLFMKIPKHVKYFSIIILYFSIFFSFRAIFVMESLFILIMVLKYNIKNKNIYLSISLMYSFLSSGTFMVWIFFIYLFRKKIISNKKILKYLNLFIIFLIIILLGPLSHKVLFFIDQTTYGSATSVTIDALLNISIGNVVTLFINIFERSFINEAYISNNYSRLTIVFIMFIMLLFLLLVQRNKLIIALFLFYIFGLFFEGLIIFSLFFISLVLFYDYIYRNLKRLFICQKKY